MKKTILIIAVFFTTIAAFSQSFEGEIKFSNTYKSKNPQVTNEQWENLMGSSQNYTIKKGDYKSTLDGTLFQWQLYINKDNKLYSKVSQSASVFWNDGSVQGDEVVKVELNKGVTEILGYKCDELILYCKSGIQKYYFNSTTKVDTKLFVNHKFGNWYDVLSRTNAIPIKSIIETPQYTMESVATKITPMAIDSKVFELAEGVTLEKSPF